MTETSIDNLQIILSTTHVSERTCVVRERTITVLRDSFWWDLKRVINMLVMIFPPESVKPAIPLANCVVPLDYWFEPEEVVFEEVHLEGVAFEEALAYAKDLFLCFPQRYIEYSFDSDITDTSFF